MTVRIIGTFVFASLLLALSCGAAAQSVRAISHIFLEGNRHVDRDTVLSLIHTRSGDTYNPKILLDDLQALEHSKYFQDASLSLADDPAMPNAKIVTFRLIERPIITGLKYEGLNSISPSDIAERLRARNIDLTVGSFFDPAQLSKAETAIHELLAEHGHPSAEIKLSYEPNVHQETTRLLFTITESPISSAAH